MKRVLAYIIFLFSCVLYFTAPSTYSFGYCLWIHNLFLASAVFLYMTDIKNEIVGFNVLFTISFFFTNFVYPVYIYPIDPNYSLFQFPFEISVITKCTALAQVGYSAYVCGYMYNLSRNDVPCIAFPAIIGRRKLRKIEIGVCLFVFLFILNGGLEYFEDRYLRSEMSTNMIVQYMILFFTPIVIWFSSLIFLCKYKAQSYHIYAILIAISLLLLTSGTRTIPLIIFASLFMIYCQTHKVSIPFVFLCVIIGTLLLSFIGSIRHGISESSYIYNDDLQFGWMEHFSDLFICNRGLYVFYDYVDSHSYTYGLSMLGCLLSPIPFAQRLFMNITGVPSYVLDSPNFHTFLQFGVNPPLGLGTNIVGDVYLAFGLIGVVVLFFILGRLIVYIRKGMFRGNYLYTVAYLVVASDAIYMCRAAYLDAFKSILWTTLIAWLFIRKQNKIRNA